MSYRVEISEDFDKTINKKSFKRDPNLRKLVNKTVEALEIDPYRNTGRLRRGDLEGKRRIWVGSKWRIIFTICEECRKLENESKNKCLDCEEKADNNVLLWLIDKKKRVYDR